ncbi:DMT family transporter [Bacillus atrophaeus]|uniref:DMT family transporter n=1 Tax=Bacillus atrophaeus TaxID=1452 RepID=UPI00227F1A72|nr:DMT family transporter [Bacillus atrophaeus]MCY7946014.1 DMT family transporter [Bacillus atrophaeus]MCY8096289.1 DMT family transporter [Bacillus atrophaeus]MCY9169055.1 DMT family transporter [Bacillus atrophaeus]MEC0739904.1 DMT family transporter [Bacillus atrophaeus]MEC0746430.1 DMT family transporter [Bacillus atrophaeus]
MKGNLYSLFVLAAAFFWGTTGTVQALAPEESTPLAFGAIRLLIGGSAMLLVVFISGKLDVKNWSWRLVFFAAVCMACYQPFFFTAVKETGIAVGTVIAIGSAPVIAGSLEWAVLKKRPQKSWWAATILALAGCWLLFADSSAVHVELTGVILALGAGASFAGYTLISKSLIKTQSPEASAAVIFMISALLLSPLLLQEDTAWILTGRGAGVSLYIGIIATCAAYFMFTKGLTAVPASAAVTLSLAEPLTAALLGVFFIGEMLALSSWIGIALMLLGLLVTSVSPRKHEPAGSVHVS